MAETVVSQFLFLIDGDLFCVLRCDRPYDKGDGVCVVYKTSLAPKIFGIQINAINLPGFEAIAFNFLAVSTIK